MKRRVTSPLARESGATAVEYGLILGLIAVVIILAVTFFGQNVRGLFDRSSSSIGSAIGP